MGLGAAARTPRRRGAARRVDVALRDGAARRSCALWRQQEGDAACGALQVVFVTSRQGPGGQGVSWEEGVRGMGFKFRGRQGQSATTGP